jgi:hypothetical protein
MTFSHDLPSTSDDAREWWPAEATPEEAAALWAAAPPIEPFPPEATPEGVDAEVRDLAARCRVTEAALDGLRRQGLDVAAGDPWPFDPRETDPDLAPTGSAGWWRFATTVIAVASNTHVVPMVVAVGILEDAFEIAVRAGGAR